MTDGLFAVVSPSMFADLTKGRRPSMKVLHLFPPNYAAINRAFKVRGKPVIFAYGGAIYNPSKINIPERLLDHERVHIERQGTDPAAWWDRYIVDSRFRLDEEIPAHRAEANRAPELLDDIAARLASPLYGSLISFEEARRLIAA